MAMFDMVAYPKFGLPIHSLVFELCYKKYNNFFGIRQRPATLHFFLKCLQSISDRLKCLPNRLGSVECLLNRLVTIHFLPFF
jgi:uncharacterized protein YmfQ (DUF2313 family)